MIHLAVALESAPGGPNHQSGGQFVQVGYRVSYFIEGGNLPPGLPDYLICDATLEESLERIKNLILTWAGAGDPNADSSERLRHLSISLFGPFPAQECVRDCRTPMQRLADAISHEDRLSALAGAAKDRFEAGAFEEARRYISELQDSLSRIENYWQADDLAATIHTVLGRLDLLDGNVEGAKGHLIEAGLGDGGSIRTSFGPNMSLARDLLLIGEKEAVLDYFQACKKFWKMGTDELDEWAMYVNAGRIPDFGANLVY